jgi:hypothetical protein
VVAGAPVTIDVPASGARFEARLLAVSSGKGVVTNEGHPNAPLTVLGNDVYRGSASVDSPGWSVHLQNALVTVGVNTPATASVFVTRPAGARTQARVTVTFVSETDPSRRHVAITTARVQ